MRKISIGTGTLCDIIALWDLRSNWGNFYFARYYIWQILASLWSSRAVVLYYALDSKPDLWYVCFFVQFWRKEDWGEISICGAAEFMNYIVRPMNKQTLMCFNFAGTNINFDSHFVWIFSFEIRLLLKMDTTSKSLQHSTCPFTNHWSLLYPQVLSVELTQLEDICHRWYFGAGFKWKQFPEMQNRYVLLRNSCHLGQCWLWPQPPPACVNTYFTSH